MTDTTYQDLVYACRGFYGLDQLPPCPDSLPPKMEDAFSLPQGKIDPMQGFQALPNTFRMLQSDRKHNLPARGTGSTNFSQNKRQRVEELPKEVAALRVVHFLPDITSSTPLAGSDDGYHSDEQDEEYDSDGESSAASA